MDLNGFKYHFVDEGAGEPVVMIHGNPTWSFYFRELIKALAPDVRVIAPDHIGCGLSDKPDGRHYNYRLKQRVDDLESFVDFLSLEQDVTLVMHDWGGAIGMTFALRRPERIKRIVVMNSAAFFHPKRKRMPLRLWMIRNMGPVSAAAVLGLNLFAHAAVFMASARGLSGETARGLMAPYNCWKNRIATLKFVQDIPVKNTDPSYPLLEQTDRDLHRLSGIPMLVCWGMKDFVFDSEFLAEWRRRFPEAAVHTFEDAGHYVLEDVPERIIPLVRQFLGTAT